MAKSKSEVGPIVLETLETSLTAFDAQRYRRALSRRLKFYRRITRDAEKAAIVNYALESESTFESLAAEIFLRSQVTETETPFLDRVLKLVDWIIANMDEIIKIIELIGLMEVSGGDLEGDMIYQTALSNERE